MPRIQLADVLTHYQQTGAGPDVVLIHAFTSNLSVWMMTGITEALSDYRVTMYDLRGHGASSVPPSNYDSTQMVADLIELMDQLEIRSAYLVGHSYGGVIGMHAASLHPDRVRGVILSDTYFPGLRDLEPDMGQADVWQDLRETMGKAEVELGEQVDFARLFRAVRDLAPEQLDVIKEAIGPAGVRWLTQVGQMADTGAGSEMFEESGFTAERIAAVETPVVALYDEFSPFDATCTFLKERLADCQIDMVPKAKHLAPVQNPADLVRLIKHYIDSWEAREQR